ncbi:MAG: hypothetical protein WBR26_06760 [Candidatus Acidiferrum sp.]
MPGEKRVIQESSGKLKMDAQENKCQAISKLVGLPGEIAMQAGQGGIVMRRLRWTLVIAGVALAMLGCLFLGSRMVQADKPDDKSEIERGRYLVEEVAKCGECHTPRNDEGELNQQAWLQGAPIWIEPVKPIQNWADHAPSIAGLPGFSEEEAERVLEKGIGPEGETLRPPMHIYHMSHADAKAIVAYLNSLPRHVH